MQGWVHRATCPPRSEVIQFSYLKLYFYIFKNFLTKQFLKWRVGFAKVIVNNH
jgi:hypothetical protein